MKRVLRVVAIFLVLLLAGGLWMFLNSRLPFTPPVPMPGLRLTRPYGMAPPAFHAFVRACNRAKIHPWRIGQTIGNHPMSVGYHKKDGVLTIKGERFDYCSAVDVGTGDLSPAQINRFLEELAKQGFASFHRKGGKWTGNEHIHAIYAVLPMKPQLRRQVRQYLRERRRLKKPPLKWEKTWLKRASR